VVLTNQEPFKALVVSHEKTLRPAEMALAGDETLMLALRARVPEAFEEVYRRHSSEAIRVARYYLRSAFASDDVVQDVFERLVRAPDRFDAALGSLSNYLRMQIRSACCDAQRASASRTRREAAQTTGSSRPAEEEALLALSLGRVQDGLDALDPEVRRAVELAFIEGFTYRDVARLLRIPEGTAKARIRRGLKCLRVSDFLTA
jgi:RNA polymerase sigma-70 factor (ECF subfamily)